MGKGRLFIDLLSLHCDKGFGFQQYCLNLLDFFYDSFSTIKCSEVILVVNQRDEKILYKYNNRFTIIGCHVHNRIHRALYEMAFPMILRFRKGDVLLSPANVSGVLHYQKGRKNILVIHDLLFLKKEWCPSLMRWHRIFLMPYSIKNADKIIAISNSTALELNNKYSRVADKLEVIHNPLNFAKFEETNIHNIPDVSSLSPFFLVISMSANHKNIQTVFSAFDLYINAGYNNNLVVVGNIISQSLAGKALASLSESARGKIFILEKIHNSDLCKLYKEASLYITASKYEGFGMPIIEAMSFGCPVLLSDIPVHREVSLNKGLFFNSDNVEELANNMKYVSSEKCNYSNIIKDTYSHSNTSGKYIELINSFLGS